MAVEVIVDGPVAISVGTGSANALESLGYSEAGVDVTEQLFTGDVHGDQNGGELGPPIDIQYFGEMHIIRITLTKYDESILNKIRAGLKGGTAGTPGTSGSLYFQGSYTWRLVLNSTSRPRNYLQVTFAEPKEVNKGTKFSKAVIIARAYKDSNGVIYNATVS